MQSIDLPAGVGVRFTANARSDADSHRWEVRVVAATAGAEGRLGFGSHIGGRDVHQSLHIPAQDVDCRLEVKSQHQTLNGWVDDHIWRSEDTPERLLIGYCDRSRPGARRDDLLLSFNFNVADLTSAKESAYG